MVENVWGVVCDQAIESSRTKNVSLIETIEKITVTVPPDHPDIFGVLIRHTVASVWRNTDPDNEASGRIRLTLLSPDGKETERITHEFVIEPGAFYKTYLNFKGIDLSGEGWYFFILRIKESGSERWKRGATIPVRVVYNLQEGAEWVELRQETKAEADEDA